MIFVTHLCNGFGMTILLFGEVVPVLTRLMCLSILLVGFLQEHANDMRETTMMGVLPLSCS